MHQVSFGTALTRIRQIAGSSHITRSRSSELSRAEEAATVEDDRRVARKQRIRVAREFETGLTKFDEEVEATFAAIDDFDAAAEILTSKAPPPEPPDTPAAAAAARLLRGWRITGRKAEDAARIVDLAALLRECADRGRKSLATASKRRDQSDLNLKETRSLLALHSELAKAGFDIDAPGPAAAREAYRKAANERRSTKGRPE